jgi:hypothetical protein
MTYDRPAADAAERDDDPCVSKLPGDAPTRPCSSKEANGGP